MQVTSRVDGLALIDRGRVAERLNAPVLKTGRRATPVSGVRISPLPFAGYKPPSAAVTELPNTSPAAPSACTATYGPTVPVGTGIAVSKPLRGTCAAVVRLAALAPASSRQEATSVAPFQLA